MTGVSCELSEYIFIIVVSYLLGFDEIFSTFPLANAGERLKGKNLAV
jgi:hypothetical protein